MSASLALTCAVLALLAYGGAWFSLVRRTRATAGGGDTPHDPWLRPSLLTSFALIVHGVATYATLVRSDGIDLGLPAVLNLLSWIVIAIVTVSSLRMQIERLYLLLFPLSIATLILLLFGPSNVELRTDISLPLLAHILLSLAAYAALLMAAVQSILLALQERSLKTLNRSGTPVLAQLLPPLETMERLLVAMLWMGFAFLTLSIATGFAFLDDMFAQQVVHHTVLTSASWLTYAFFLGGRYWLGWRGLTAVRWTLCAFALLVLGYLGSKFVLEYILVE